MTIEERLEKLERELARARRRRWLVLAVAGITAGAYFLWTGFPEFAGAKRVVHAREFVGSRFVLQDARGRRRACLGFGYPTADVNEDTEEPFLMLEDRNGDNLVTLAIGDGRGGLSLRTAKVARIVNDFGCADMGFEKGGKPRLWLVGADGAGWTAPVK